VAHLVILKCKIAKLRKVWSLGGLTNQDTIGKLLVWDSCEANIAQDIKSFLKTKGFDLMPAGLTGYVKADNIGIYKSLKDKTCSLIIEWNEFTRDS